LNGLLMLAIIVILVVEAVSRLLAPLIPNFRSLDSL